MNAAVLFAIAALSLHAMSSSSPTAVSALSSHSISSQSVVVIGLNAALQKRFILPPATNLLPGNVHRAHRCETGVGGKGQDVGVALACLASREPARASRVLLAQFLGAGPAGDAVARALSGDHGLGLGLTVRNAAPLRTCTTVVGADAATELVEASGAVTGEEMAALRGRVEALAAEGGRADAVCVMGSMPPGCGEDAYADLTARLAGRRTLVLIDSVVGLAPLLGALADLRAAGRGDGAAPGQGGGAVLKVNAAELCRLAGAAGGAGEADRATREEVAAAARGFLARHPDAAGALDYLCVTDGRWPGHLVEVPPAPADPPADPRTWELPAVDLEGAGTLYPIGAGDTVAAGTLAAWQYLRHRAAGDDAAGFRGVVPDAVGARLAARRAEWGGDAGGDGGGLVATAFAFGLACGAASCLQPENSVFETDAAVAFFDGMAKPALR